MMEQLQRSTFCWPSRRIRRWRNTVGQRFGTLSFLIVHYLWFSGTCLVTSIILWATAPHTRPLGYIDAIFLTISAMSEAGLTTVGLSSLTTFHQAVLFFLIFIGSTVFVSSTVLQIRKHTFETKLQELAEHRHFEILRLKATAQRHATTSKCHDTWLQTDIGDALDLWDLPNPDNEHAQSGIPGRSTTNTSSLDADSTSHLVPSKPDRLRIRSASTTNSTPHSQRQSIQEPAHARPGPGHRWTSASSLFPGWRERERDKNNLLKSTLTKAERDRLGGIEYRALKFLTWIVPLYVICFQLFGCIGCGAYLHFNRPDIALANEMNSFWTGAFFAVSAFNNNGMALNDNNMSALQTSYYMLLTLSFLILAGNTCFPPFLRLIVWSMRKCLPRDANSERIRGWRSVLTFILDHPRRLYTHLFSSEATWWLVLSLIVLNGIDWFAFEVFNITNPAVTQIPMRFRVLNGLFQAFAVRKGGFFVVPLSELYPGTLVTYIVMMFINALPIRTAISTTSRYEDQSLEISPGEEIATTMSQAEDGAVLQPIKSTRALLSFRLRGEQIMTRARAHQISSMQWKQDLSKGRLSVLRNQLRGKLSQDLWWIALAILLITVIETTSVRLYPDVFSVFNIAFEVISGWGTVGVSTGLPWDVSSFCGAWHTGSKLVLAGMMLRGRHVGLPGAIDRAILLPEVSLVWSRAQDVHIVCGCGHYTGDAAAGSGNGLSDRDGRDQAQPRASTL